jgi:hypothetical protein
VTVGIGCFRHVGLKVLIAPTVVGKNSLYANAGIFNLCKIVVNKGQPLLDNISQDRDPLTNLWAKKLQICVKRAMLKYLSRSVHGVRGWL